MKERTAWVNIIGYSRQMITETLEFEDDATEDEMEDELWAWAEGQIECGFDD